MSILLKIYENTDAYIKIRAFKTFLRSRKLYVTDRYFQVLSRTVAVRAAISDVSEGAYQVEFRGDTMMQLTDVPGAAALNIDHLFSDTRADTSGQIMCGSVQSIQDQVARVANVFIPAMVAAALYDRHIGRIATIMYGCPNAPVIILIPGITIAILPQERKVTKLISGLPLTDRNALKIKAETEGTSVNKLILGAISRLLACLVVMVLIGCTDAPTVTQAPAPDAPCWTMADVWGDVGGQSIQYDGEASGLIALDWPQPDLTPWKIPDPRLLRKVWRCVDPWAAATVPGEG